MHKNKTIIVTGGAGFIGSALIKELLKYQYFKVVNVDKLTYAGNLESLKVIEDSERYFFEKIDICDASQVKNVINKYRPNIIMHLAAESHVDRSISSPYEFINTNIIGTYNILEESRKYWECLGSKNKIDFRLHHISTDEVYGDLPHPDLQKKNKNEDLKLFTEKTPYNPSSPYSATKASSDHLVRAWNKTYKLPTLITNCSNNYGPYHYPEKLIPLTILSALNKKPINIYGEGNQIRDWLYVEDHAKALIKVALDGNIGETYNIGGHNEKRNIDVVNTICEILNEMVSDEYNYKDLIRYVKDRPGHDMRYAIDSTKIKKDLGWLPLETFESGIKKTVQWYLKNQDWCKRAIENNNTSNKRV